VHFFFVISTGDPVVGMRDFFSAPQEALEAFWSFVSLVQLYTERYFPTSATDEAAEYSREFGTEMGSLTRCAHSIHPISSKNSSAS